jgi:hypothetical protein
MNIDEIKEFFSKRANLREPFDQERVDEIGQKASVESIVIERRPDDDDGRIEGLDFSSWSSLEHLEKILTWLTY